MSKESKRRRIVKPSSAENYKKEFDFPGTSDINSIDEDNREVILDSDDEDPPTEEQFWKEQLPPHYE